MKFIPNVVTRTVGRNVLKAKKNSPHFFFAGGIIGVVTGTVLACKATLKLEDTLDEIRTDFEKVKTLNKHYQEQGTPYSDQEYYRNLGAVYIKGGIELGKLYGPSIIVGSVAIASLTGSHVQLSRRNQALTITLAAVSKAFDEYRIRVQEEIGKEREYELHKAITSEKVEGKKELVKTANQDGWSPYCKFFDSTNPNWSPNSEYNRIFIECQQNYANHMLQARGHVFLNDVYDQLGFDRTTPGAVVGWVRNGNGDGFIDFGIDEAFGCLNDDLSYILDFNVDGVVYDQI